MLIANNRSLDKAVWLSFNSDALAPLWCGVYFGRGGGLSSSCFFGGVGAGWWVGGGCFYLEEGVLNY